MHSNGAVSTSVEPSGSTAKQGQVAAGSPLAVRLADVQFQWPKGLGPVLDIPEFSVVKGETLLIQGPSGSGKTTLLNLLAGVTQPTHGVVEVAGATLSSRRTAARDKFRADHIGFIFQIFNLVPYLSVVENVILPCRFSRARRDRVLASAPTLVAEAQRLVGYMGLDLAQDGGRSVADLSIGQQQRVAAARALIGSPDLIIADEPTSALDSRSRDRFLALLFEQAEAAETTVIVVSHDEALTRIFPRVVNLQDINRVAVHEQGIA